MRTYSQTQKNLAAGDYVKINWFFRVVDVSGNVYFWSTKAYSGDSTSFAAYNGNIDFTSYFHGKNEEYLHDYTAKIKDFPGITVRRSSTELSVIAPNDLTFTVLNKGNILSPEDFEDGKVLVSLGYENASGTKKIMRRWKFDIVSITHYKQRLKFRCEDFLQKYLRGDYPNTNLVEAALPDYNIYRNSERSPKPGTREPRRDNTCVPITWGTAYIPLRPVFGSGYSHVWYLIGETISGETYTISEVSSPTNFGNKSTWDAGSYTMTQGNDTGLDGTLYRFLKAEIADSDGNGIADTQGVWQNGDYLYDMPTKMSFSGRTQTNPAYVIRETLKDFGVGDAGEPGAEIASWKYHACKNEYADWGLTFNGGWWFKQPREPLLENLLNSCHQGLRVSERIEQYIKKKTSVFTVLKSHVAKTSPKTDSPTSFKYSSLTKTNSDSGFVGFQESGKPQDSLIKALVGGVEGTTDKISGEVLENYFVQDSQDIQRLGTLYYQRKFFKRGTVSFTSGPPMVSLDVDDTITMGHTDYGGVYDIVIDSINYRKSGAIDFSLTRYKKVERTFQSNSDFSVSTDGYTATKISADLDWDSIRTDYYGTDEQGEYYEFEVTDLQGRLHIGIANEDFTLTDRLGSDTDGIAYDSFSGDYYYNGALVAYGDTYTTGDIISVHRKGDSVWFGKNGVIQNSGNPETGVNPAISSLDTTKKWYPVFCARDEDDAAKITPTHEMSYYPYNGFSPTSILNDWEDLSPAAITVQTDATSHKWHISASGPIATTTTGKPPHAQTGNAYSVLDGSDNEILRIGIDGSDLGMHIYDTSGNKLAQYLSDKIIVGREGANQPNMIYDTTDGLRIRINTTDHIKFDTAGNAYILNSLVMGTNGFICSVDKTDYSDTDAGFFIGYDASEADYVINIGDDQSWIKWNSGMSIRLAEGETFDLYGDLKVAESGDIYFVAAASGDTTGAFYWQSSDEVTKIEMFGVLSTDGSTCQFSLRPTDTLTSYMYFGSSGGYKWEQINFYTRDQYYSKCITGGDITLIAQSPTSVLIGYDVTLSSQDVYLYIDKTNGFMFKGSAKPIYWASDNSCDIGKTGANRPKDVYIAGAIKEGDYQASSISTTYTDAKCTATWPNTYSADQNLLEASNPTFNNLALTGDITIATDQWVGLGSGKGLIQFSDTTVDEINFLNCHSGWNTQAPDTYIHIQDASAGTATLDKTTDRCMFLIEGDDHTYMAILTPNNKRGGILFPDPDNESVALFRYNHSTDQFDWKSNNSYVLTLTNAALTPYSASAIDFGSNALPIKDIFYSGSITDTACPMFFPDACDALSAMTIGNEIDSNGYQKFNFNSVPSIIRKPANGAFIIDTEGNRIEAKDGYDITKLLYITVNATREIDQRLKKMEI